MDETLPEYTDKMLRQHGTVRAIIDRCTAATRQWINGDVSHDYLVMLTGLAGECLTSAEEDGLEGHEKGDLQSRQEADVLIARLIEARELLRYPRYAAGSLESDRSLTDSAETRRKLVDQHIASEPGQDFPSP